MPRDDLKEWQHICWGRIMNWCNASTKKSLVTLETTWRAQRVGHFHQLEIWSRVVHPYTNHMVRRGMHSLWTSPNYLFRWVGCCHKLHFLDKLMMRAWNVSYGSNPPSKQRIWKALAPTKIMEFMWLSLKNRLRIGDILAQKGWGEFL